MKDEIRNLMFDLSEGREIFDAEEGRVISASEANEVLANYCREDLGLTKDATDRQIKRAFETEKGREFFQVIEEIIDNTVATGWGTNEFFNTYVDVRNMKDGDRNEFYTEKDVLLVVAKTAGSHHDILYCSVRVAKAA